MHGRLDQHNHGQRAVRPPETPRHPWSWPPTPREAAPAAGVGRIPSGWARPTSPRTPLSRGRQLPRRRPDCPRRRQQFVEGVIGLARRREPVRPRRQRPRQPWTEHVGRRRRRAGVLRPADRRVGSSSSGRSGRPSRMATASSAACPTSDVAGRRQQVFREPAEHVFGDRETRRRASARRGRCRAGGVGRLPSRREMPPGPAGPDEAAKSHTWRRAASLGRQPPAIPSRDARRRPTRTPARVAGSDRRARLRARTLRKRRVREGRQRVDARAHGGFEAGSGSDGGAESEKLVRRTGVVEQPQPIAQNIGEAFRVPGDESRRPCDRSIVG